MIARCSVTIWEVFAVPGNITSRNSFGTNYLIKGAGAKLVQGWQDVAAELPPEVAARLLPPEPRKGSIPSPDAAPPGLTEIELAAYELLATDEPAHIDALAEAAAAPVAALAAALLNLEMRGLARQLPGKCFVKVL